MGLANPEEAIYRGINVDYGRSAAQLFANIALAAINGTNLLDILQKCHKGGSADVPTWAPDWSMPCNYKYLRTRQTRVVKEGHAGNTPKNFYNAANSLILEFEVSDEKKGSVRERRSI
jgi:hypothetical protein